MDAEGHVWSVQFGAGNIRRIAPDGTLERVIEMPVKWVASLTFGGVGMDEIYVTTIGGDTKEKSGKDSGALLRLNMGIEGVPDFYSRVGLS